MQISYNLISIILGVSMILTCCLIAFMFQRHFFSKYRNKVKNIMDTK